MRKRTAKKRTNTATASLKREKLWAFRKIRTGDYRQTTKKTICLCLPGETFSDFYVHAILQLHASLLQHPLFKHAGVCMCHTSNVYATRYIMAEMVLDPQQPRADYVLWIDDDNTATVEQVNQLIQDLETHPELSGVVGWCWCDRHDEKQKGQPFVMSCGRQSDDLVMLPFTVEDLERAQSDPLVPIDWSGFPCVLLPGKPWKSSGRLPSRLSSVPT